MGGGRQSPKVYGIISRSILRVKGEANLAQGTTVDCDSGSVDYRYYRFCFCW